MGVDPEWLHEKLDEVIGFWTGVQAWRIKKGVICAVATNDGWIEAQKSKVMRLRGGRGRR